MHETSLRLLRHPVFHQRRRDLILIAPQLTALQQCAAVIEITVLVSLVEISGKGHIQLQGSQLGRQHREAVLTRDDPQRPAVIPLHVDRADVIHEIHLALGTGSNRSIGILHGIETDAGAGRILLLDEIHHFSVHIRVLLHGLFSVVEFKFIDHAAVFVPRILYLDRRAIKDIGIGLGEICSEALAAVIGRKSTVGLIFDFGIEAYCLHRGHDTGQPHQIRVIFLDERLKLYARLDEAFQSSKVFDCDRLSLLIRSLHVHIPPSVILGPDCGS